MALIYSYPSLTPLSGLDTLLVSDATDDNRTTNVSIAELSEYIATYTLLEGNSDAADFVNGLKELITIDGQNVRIEGLASSSSVDALSESRAAFETKVTADQESAFASLKLEVDSEFKSYVNGKLLTYASSDAVTELISETTADYAIASDVTKLNAQFEFDAGGNITGTSGALVTAINAASANSDQAFATQVNKLNAQFNIDGDGNITGLSSANIDSVKSVVASEGYASATSQAEIQADLDDASATASDNVTAIATETLARVTKDEELVASIGNEEDGTGVYAAVRTVAEAVVTESEARAQEKTTLEAAIGSNTSAFEDYVIVKATEDAAQAIREQNMNTEFRGNNTAFQNFKNITYADAEQARSEEISTIRASASGAGALAGANSGEITENKRVIADIEGKIESTWNLDVIAGNRVAGIKLEANNETSSVTFNADAFKIYNGDFTKTPFYIENDNVYIDSATIKNISFGDQIVDVPDDLGTTAIFADDADGTNPSTTQGTKNFVLIVNKTWKDGEALPGGVFNQIEGDTGGTGYTPVKYTDYGDGIDGSYTTFVFLESNAQPSTPTGGTYDGTTEVMPNGGWYDEPSVSLYDTEWVSKAVYKNTKTFQNETQTSTWAHSGWSTPSKIYQKGEVGLRGPAGDPGTGINILGTLDSTDDIPNDVTHEPGDSYLISGNLHVYDGTIFNDVGQIEGPSGPQGAPGDRGDKGDTGLDGYNGNDGTYTSFVYKVYDTRPAAPTGGTYDGATETYPSHATQGAWTDNPSVDDEDTEWRSSIKYKNTKTFDDSGENRVETSTWAQVGTWSTPVKIYQKGNPGTPAINGTNVRVEFSANNANWSTTPPAGVKYQRTAADTNGNGVYTTFGPSVKFVPEAGVEYQIPEDGSSAFLHIKFSDDNVRFTKDETGARTGETPGKYMGTYVSRTTGSSTTPPADSTTFSDYKWNKVGAEDPVIPPTKFTWIKYADNIHGSAGFGDAHEGKDYVGYAYNKDTSTASLDRLDYIWHRRTGIDADVKYMWVRYSDSATGSNYVSNSAGKDYVGFAYNKSTVNPPNGTPASDFDWSKVGGTTGEAGRKVVTGTLFFQAKSENAPSLAGAIGKSYFFNANSVADEVKSAGWDVKTPQMTAGTASNNYWSVPFTAVQNENSNKGTLAFGTVTRAFAFNQVVTFDSLESDGTTEINGANIKTGAIQSQNYSNSSGDGYSSNGMKIDLEGSGSIHAEQFYINADGSTSFKGKHTAGELGNWKVENGSLKDSSDRIVLNPSSKAVELKDQSGNIKANVRASTTLKSTDTGFKSVVFSSTYSLKLNLKEQVTVPTTSSLTSRFESKYSRISNDITLAAGEKWEAKASEIPFANFDISNKWFNSEKNLIPSVSYSVAEPSSTVKNTYGYVNYADIYISDQVSQAYVERTLQLELLKRGSQSHSVVKTVTLSRAKKTGGLNFERWRKNAYSNNWYKFVNPVSYEDTSYNIPQSEELVFDIAEDGDYYFRLKLITEAGNGKNISKSSGGTNSTFYGGTFDFDPPYNNYIFSALSGPDRNFKVYSSQNYAELSGGGLQVVTNYNKWVKLKRNEPGVNEAANVLIETKGGRVELENDKGEEALRVNADTKINGLLSVSGGVDNFNTNWSGIETGGFALKTDTYVEGSADNQYNLSNDGDGNLTYGLKVNGDSSFHLSPSSTKQNYRLPFEYGTRDDGEGLEYKQGQIITLINISSSNNANVLGIITANGAISPRVVVPGEALTLQFYKSNNRLQNWGSHNTYRGWFILSSYINAPNE